MRQRLVDCMCWLLLCSASLSVFGADSNHLSELKSKFPYGLLGDDYGILSLNDLKRNVCGVRPRPFGTSSHHYPYEYWQCFESKAISFDCDSNGTPDEYEGVMGLIVAKASANGVRHEYIARRLWPIKDCRQFIRDATALLKRNKYACISASFIENEKDRLGQSISWLFERIKTKKGCEGQGCDFTRKFKQENCPNLKL